MVDFTLTDRQRELQRRARDFAVEIIVPAAEKADRIIDPEKAFNWSVVQEASKRGLRTLSVPKEFGGEGADVLTLAVVGEQLAYGDLGIAVAFDQTWKIMTMLSHIVTDEQRKRWMPQIVADPEFLLGIASSEPESGSDKILPYDAPGSGISTRAERKGDKWIINGTKRYISNGGLAKLYYVITRTDPNSLLSQGVTGFLVPAGAPGFTVPEVWDKLGQRTVQNGTLVFKDVEVPDRDRVTEVGGGFHAMGAFLLRFGSNIQAGATVLGVAQRAYDLSLQYAFERVQGGGPLINSELQRVRLARMAMKLQAARSYLWYAGWYCAQPDFDRKQSALSKIFASEVAVEVCREALELWGGAGYMRKNPIEKLFRDALSFLHSDGTNDVLSLKAGNLIAQEALDKSDGRYDPRVSEAAKGR
jgi:acyl-CoA dehydrogenase